MTELQLLQQILVSINLFFYVYLLFKFLEWARRILAKWKKGHGEFSV